MAKITDVNKLVKIEQDGDTQRVICTSSLICSILDISRETLSEWVKRGCPKIKNGWYDLSLVIEWKFKTSDDEDEDDVSEGTKNKWMIRKNKAAALRQEFENEVKFGQYLLKSDVAEEFALRILEVKKSLLLMPNAISSKVVDIDMRKLVKEVIREYVYNMLDQYSRTGEFTPKPGDIDE